jgi:quercetin dioxygenase-like cupin family protein
MMTPKYLISAGEGKVHQLAQVGVRLLHVDPPGTGVTILEHPINPRGLASPMHTHANEDEFSWIMEGRVGFDIGGEVFEGGPGDFVSKPRAIPHAFWNAGDTTARVCEIISPAGFEQYFLELAAIFETLSGPPGPNEFPKLVEIAQKYSLNMDMASIPTLLQKHGLTLG